MFHGGMFVLLCCLTASARAVRADVLTNDRAGERVGERTTDRAGERVGERTTDRAEERVGERTTDRAGERVGERTTDRAGERVGERTTDRAEERVGERVEERRGESAGERVRPECAPHQHLRCQWLTTEVDEYRGCCFDVYSVNGQELRIFTGDSKNRWYEVRCSDRSIDDPAWPRFPRLEHFYYVELFGCAPPAGASYAATLRALNVSTGDLQLWNIPRGARMSAATLAGLPPTLIDLTLTTAGVGRVLEPGALAALDGVRKLKLIDVYPDQLPMHLEALHLVLTGVEVLPPAALNVVELTIEEKDLKRISGSAPRLRSLVLRAPALESLEVRDTSGTLLRAGLLEASPRLQALALRGASAPALPAGLLRGAANLTSFVYTHGQITTLPYDLFNYTTRLQVIDLSFNQLESLPREAFSLLRELRVLRLEHNRLRARALRLAPPAALVALSLAGNPLGDLCSTDNSSSLPALPHLRQLSLARTGVTRVCAGVLRAAPALLRLDLRHNAVRRLACADLRAPRPDHTLVDLRHNELERLECDDAAHDAVDDSEHKEIILLTDPNVKCECSCPGVWRQCAGAPDGWSYIGKILAAVISGVAAAIGACCCYLRARNHSPADNDVSTDRPRLAIPYQYQTEEPIYWEIGHDGEPWDSREALYSEAYDHLPRNRRRN